MPTLPSLLDEELLALTRSHVNVFLRRFLDPQPEGRVLEVGPKLAWPGFETLDINPAVNPTLVGDICDCPLIPDDSYDMVLMISVLEHVLDPWAALAECRRILKPHGLLLVQTPFNFRIHGPLPDLWRFTEHGLKLMLKDWDQVEINACETSERPLMPAAYTVAARCNKTKDIDPRTLTWRWI